MRRLAGYDAVREAMVSIRGMGRGFVTNFFLPPVRVDRLVAEDALFIFDTEECQLLLHRDGAFYHLYYLAAGLSALEQGLELFLGSDGVALPLTVDVVGNTPATNVPMVELLRRCGFADYQRLHRMSRTEGLDAPQEADSRVRLATKGEAEQVHSLLVTYFDPYSEQIPSLGEVVEMAAAERVLVICGDGGEVIGFVIFEINGMTSYLRYWFSHPDHRDKGVGAGLLRRFFAECSGSKRQLFWVIDTNVNAIERYRHYGFRDEAMCDDILVRNIENKI